MLNFWVQVVKELHLPFILVWNGLTCLSSGRSFVKTHQLLRVAYSEKYDLCLKVCYNENFFSKKFCVETASCLVILEPFHSIQFSKWNYCTIIFKVKQFIWIFNCSLEILVFVKQGLGKEGWERATEGKF